MGPRSSGGDGDNWAQIDAAFQAALEQPSELRSQWVSRQYAAQADIRDAVLDLLADEQASKALFESAINERDRIAMQVLMAEDGTDQVGNLVGSMIGPYRLEQLLATGGMGAVYRAERADGQFEQTVAIKILPGWATNDNTIARLKAERQILAGLRHPSITNLLDGGETGDGFPYLVTEFIDGVAITEYTKQAQLRIRKRLELFAKVADAIHYAHKKLVIHRDIKPANILVDKAGHPHLLDFGIAKLLETSAHEMTFLQTATGFTPMTPEYASPEQRSGKEVTTASDVYQLGLLLFHMLTGIRASKNAASLAGSTTRPSTAVLAGEPTNSVPDAIEPARLARKLKGDLDTIVLKALRVDPEERYSSAAEMAADIRRYLKGEAIEARPETLWSATKRLSRHYPFAAVLTASLVTVLLIWATSLFFYSQELELQRDEATRQALRATQVKDVLIDIFRRSDPLAADTIGGKTASVWDSLDAAAAETRKQLAEQPEIQAELFATLAGLYRYAGEMDKARNLLLEALTIYRSLGPGFELEIAVNQAEYAGYLGWDDYASARPLMEEALGLMSPLAAENPAAAVGILLDAGNLDAFVGEFDRSLTYFRRATGIIANSKISESLQIEVLVGEADVLISQDKLARAETLLEQALQLGEQHFGPNHRRLVSTLSTLGTLNRRRGHLEQAIDYSQRAVDLLERDSATTYSSLLSAKNNLALAYGAAGMLDKEQTILRELLKIRWEIDGPEGSVDLAISIKNLASSLHLTGDYEEALQALDEARELTQRHFPPDSPFQALPHFTSALIYLDTRQPALAEKEALAALAILEPALGEKHFQVQVTRCVIAETYRQQGKPEAARALAEPAMQGILAAGTNTPRYIKRCRDTLAALDAPR